MSILLSKEEIREAGAWLGNPKMIKREIAKAQLKKVALDLGQKCTRTEGQSSFVEVYVQKLLKEVE